MATATKTHPDIGYVSIWPKAWMAPVAGEPNTYSVSVAGQTIGTVTKFRDPDMAFPHRWFGTDVHSFDTASVGAAETAVRMLLLSVLRRGVEA